MTLVKTLPKGLKPASRKFGKNATKVALAAATAALATEDAEAGVVKQLTPDEWLIHLVNQGYDPKQLDTPEKVAQAINKESVHMKTEGTPISSSFPVGANAEKLGYDPIANRYVIGEDRMLLKPDMHAKNLALMAKYPGVKTGAKTASGQSRAVGQHFDENLRAIYGEIPEDIKEVSRLWYDGANRIASQFADTYGVSHDAASAVLASLSPQKDWYMNASLGERVMDFMANHKDKPIPDEVLETMHRIYPDEVEGTGKQKGQMVRSKHLDDKTALRDKPDWEAMNQNQKAMYLRAWDETYNDRGHRIVSPDGRFLDWKMTETGEKTQTGWGSNGEITKAINVIEDQSYANISKTMGGMHKVRSFYNNISVPDDAMGDITVDTHAMAASSMQPLAGEDFIPSHGFGSATGSSSSNVVGSKGAYAIHADSYRRIADEFGYLPREMQSIIWEGVRGLFPDTFKNTKNKKHIEGIWKRYESGKLNKQQAINEIFEFAGGIESPDWVPAGGNMDEFWTDPGAMSSFKEESIITPRKSLIRDVAGRIGGRELGAAGLIAGTGMSQAGEGPQRDVPGYYQEKETPVLDAISSFAEKRIDRGGKDAEAMKKLYQRAKFEKALVFYGMDREQRKDFMLNATPQQYKDLVFNPEFLKIGAKIIFDDTKEYAGKSLVGAADAFLTLATGAVSGLGGFAAAAPVAPFDPEGAAAIQQAVAEKGTWMSRTEEGLDHIMGAVDTLEGIDFDAAPDYVFDKTGSPALAAGTVAVQETPGLGDAVLTVGAGGSAMHDAYQKNAPFIQDVLAGEDTGFSFRNPNPNYRPNETDAGIFDGLIELLTAPEPDPFYPGYMGEDKIGVANKPVFRGEINLDEIARELEGY